MSRIDEVLELWFGTGERATLAERRHMWFGGDPAFDGAVRRELAADHERAAAGQLRHWWGTARGCLALVLLLDQAPRHLFRDTAKAFATDRAARAVAQHAFDAAFEEALTPAQRLFLVLPFGHSEEVAHQRRSVELAGRHFAADPSMAGSVDRAAEYLRLIERFGRFPHRNAALGRATTPAERLFLETAWIPPGARLTASAA